MRLTFSLPRSLWITAITAALAVANLGHAVSSSEDDAPLFAAGNAVRFVAPHAQAGLLGTIEWENGVDAGVRVKQIGQNRPPYFSAEKVIPVKLAEIRPAVSADYRFAVGAWAQVTNKESYLKQLAGKVLASDGKTAIFSVQQTKDRDPTPYQIPESDLEPTRESLLRPAKGEKIRFNDPEEGALFGREGVVVHQNGREATVEYKNQSGTMVTQTRANGKLESISHLIMADFSPEFFEETLGTLITVSYGSKQILFQRLVKKLLNHPVAGDIVQQGRAVEYRRFVLIAIASALRSFPSQVEAQQVLPEYEKSVLALAPAPKENAALTHFQLADPTKEAAGDVIEACIAAILPNVNGAEAAALNQLHLAVGVFQASLKRSANVEALIAAYDAQVAATTRLEANPGTQGLVISMQAVFEFLKKKN